MGLVIPKCNAEKATLKLTLRLYYDADEWVSNAKLIDELSQALIKAGIEDVQKEPQSYTKKTQVLSYYGLIEWEDHENSQSNRRITQEGKQMYQLLDAGDKKGVQELLISIMQSHTFGRNVLGCNSDSDLEPPCIFVKSTLILDYLTKQEFAYILGRMEFDHKEYGDALFDVLLKRKAGVPITLDAKTQKWADPKPILALEHWGILVKGQKGFILDEDLVSNYYEGLSNLRTKNTDSPKSWSLSSSSQALIQDEYQDIPSKYRPFVTAIKTKPFLLLAGISGTGKSSIVRKLAKACWPKESTEREAGKPRNFEMVQVKPNWHDSTELMGYVSRVSGKAEFVAGDFLKFVERAWEEPDVPYFLCLDEMNLAPVEQYFAEYLSVIESRKVLSGGEIEIDPIFKKEREPWYLDLCNKLTGLESQQGGAAGGDVTTEIEKRLLGKESDNTSKKKELRDTFYEHGICLPKNLVVVGTVNMDETTFSFSRKVLDRAMTIEMNEFELKGGLTQEENEIDFELGKDYLIGTAVEGKDVYEDNKDVCDKVLEYLKEVNGKLQGSPFAIAYRTRNDFLLYVVNNLPYNKDDNGNELKQELVIARALDEITNMKILSRIEGDETKVTETMLGELEVAIRTGLTKQSKEYVSRKNSEGKDILPVSLAKIDEMKKRLETTGYTSFWS